MNTGTHADAVMWCMKILSLNNTATPGPWSAKHRPGERDANIIEAQDPWRRSFGRGHCESNPKDRRDVAVMSGGTLSQAKDNAELVSFYRVLAPLVANAYLSLSQQIQVKDDQLLENPNLATYDEAIRTLRGAGGTGLAMALLHGFISEVLDAMDRFMGELGFEATNRAEVPRARLLSGGDKMRELRVALLRSVADIANPAWQREHLEHHLPLSKRSTREGFPSMVQLYRHLPDEIRKAMGELHTKSWWNDITNNGTETPQVVIELPPQPTDPNSLPVEQ